MTQHSPDAEPETLRWLQREHALELFRNRRVRISSDAGAMPVRQGDSLGDVDPSNDGDGVIVEYMDNRGIWEPAMVRWETFQALSSVSSGTEPTSDSEGMATRTPIDDP